MIREDGSSTIRVVSSAKGVCAGTDYSHPGLSVDVRREEVTIHNNGFAFAMPAAIAWALRDLLPRTLDESACPAQA